jgi:CheY-like chemotaxis protein
VHVPLLSEAVDLIKLNQFAVVLLDLRLPDSTGVESVSTVRGVLGETPIVVLTGTDDEELALACIDAGAQDYLSKTEVRARSLRRAIGYAITRIREAQVREWQETLESYRALSSSAHGTTITAALAGSGAVAVRSPQTFERIAREYFALLTPYLERLEDKVRAPRSAMERIVTFIGDASGGPRDLLDVHVAALDRAITISDDPHSRSLVVEARLLALEMMGLLVDYYRVGMRRYGEEG